MQPLAAEMLLRCQQLVRAPAPGLRRVRSQGQAQQVQQVQQMQAWANKAASVKRYF